MGKRPWDIVAEENSIFNISHDQPGYHRWITTSRCLLRMVELMKGAESNSLFGAGLVLARTKESVGKLS